MRRFVLGLLTFWLSVGPTAAQAVDGAHVSIEANLLVTHDIAMPHMQSDVAINPLNPRDIVGSTTVFSRTSVSLFNKAYTSLDGGYTWSDTTPYGERQGVTADPQVAFTNHGTALFVTLDARDRFCDVYRSADGGITWGRRVRLPTSNIDHEVVAVDHTLGRYANRIYIAGEGGLRTPSEERRIELYTSDDDGRTFVLRSIPETGVIGPGQRFDHGGVIVMGLEILSDETVVMDFSRYVSASDMNTDFQRNFVTTSIDGGRTFGRAMKVADVFVGSRSNGSLMLRREVEKRNGDVSDVDPSWVKMAAGSSAARYRDRLYAVWQDQRSGSGRITYAYSSDDGRTWSPPRRVGIVDPDESQFQAMVATNDQGTVAIAWYSTAGFPTRTQFNVYIAISTDGGRAFSEPVRVSSQPSFPRTPGNLTPVPFVYDEASARAPEFFSAYSLCPQGGDEVGLAGGSDGDFQFYWPDSRGTEYEIYATRVHTTGGMEAPMSAVSHNVTDDIVLAFDPVLVNAATGEVDVPVRLRNVSRHVLFGPIAVEFLGSTQAEVLNATSGGTGRGATFDYSDAMGSYGALPPGGVTEPVLWRFHATDLDSFSPIALNVRVVARY